MDSQLFYFLNLIFAGAFLLWFLLGRKNSSLKSTTLNLKAGESKEKTKNLAPSSPVGKKPFVHDYPVKYTPRERDVTGTNKIARENLKKTQSFHFVYNSHDWNAYEVLGLSPGASLPQLTARYQELLRAAESGKQEFLETAYKTLLRNY